MIKCLYKYFYENITWLEIIPLERICSLPVRYRCLNGKLWYLQHNCVGDTIVYDKDSNMIKQFYHRLLYPMCDKEDNNVKEHFRALIQYKM